MTTKEVKRREREIVFDAVRSVIHEWDPFDLWPVVHQRMNSIAKLVLWFVN